MRQVYKRQIDLSRGPSPPPAAEEGSMSRAKRSSRKRAMSPVHPHAAAVDIGATSHVAAVGPDRDPEPVRSFGPFTADPHRLPDRPRGRGGGEGALGSTRGYL